MFETRRPRGPRIASAVVGAVLLLAVGLWFGGHPSWLPGPLRSAFTSENHNDKIVNQVIGLLQHDYYRKVDTSTLVNKGLQAAVASLDDPYSHYYDPSDYRSFQSNVTDPHLTGIGVSIVEASRGIRIVEVYRGTPAAKAGLTVGDVITAVGSTSLANRSAKYSRTLITGRAGTTVTLTVATAKGATLHKSLKRADVTQPVADGRVIDDHGTKLGYVQMTSFTQGSGDQVRDEVDQVRKQGARAIILDLRDNGGGLLQEAVNVASIFIPDGTIVSTDGRAQPREVYMAKGDAIPSSIPMVDLVNRDTASSAEIVTGALRDRGRATIVGTHTYGKGVFQEIQPLRNGGALDFTVGEYFTPDGHNLGGGGVKRGQGIKPQVYATDRPGTVLLGKHDHQLAVGERVVTAKLR